MGQNEACARLTCVFNNVRSLPGELGVGVEVAAVILVLAPDPGPLPIPFHAPDPENPGTPPHTHQNNV